MVTPAMPTTTVNAPEDTLTLLLRLADIVSQNPDYEIRWAGAEIDEIRYAGIQIWPEDLSHTHEPHGNEQHTEIFATVTALANEHAARVAADAAHAAICDAHGVTIGGRVLDNSNHGTRQTTNPLPDIFLRSFTATFTPLFHDSLVDSVNGVDYCLATTDAIAGETAGGGNAFSGYGGYEYTLYSLQPGATRWVAGARIGTVAGQLTRYKIWTRTETSRTTPVEVYRGLNGFAVDGANDRLLVLTFDTTSRGNGWEFVGGQRQVGAGSWNIDVYSVTGATRLQQIPISGYTRVTDLHDISIKDGVIYISGNVGNTATLIAYDYTYTTSYTLTRNSAKDYTLGGTIGNTQPSIGDFNISGNYIYFHGLQNTVRVYSNTIPPARQSGYDIDISYIFNTYTGLDKHFGIAISDNGYLFVSIPGSVAGRITFQKYRINLAWLRLDRANNCPPVYLEGLNLGDLVGGFSQAQIEEFSRDAVYAALVVQDGLTKAVDDAANTITLGYGKNIASAGVTIEQNSQNTAQYRIRITLADNTAIVGPYQTIAGGTVTPPAAPTITGVSLQTPTATPANRFIRITLSSGGPVDSPEFVWPVTAPGNPPTGIALQQNPQNTAQWRVQITLQNGTPVTSGYVTLGSGTGTPFAGVNTDASLSGTGVDSANQLGITRPLADIVVQAIYDILAVPGEITKELNQTTTPWTISLDTSLTDNWMSSVEAALGRLGESV